MAKVINNLTTLYNPITPLPKRIYVFLIPLPKTIVGGGGKFIPLKGLSVEGSSDRMTEIRTIEIILHELIHFYFEKTYREKVDQFIKENTSKAEQYQLLKSLNIPSVAFGIKEITATSLTIKPVFMSETASLYQKLLIYTSQKLQPSINHYLKTKKPLDENFIKEILKLWKLYLKK